jgi:uncharacterized CHY-type Zn-finger protein
MQPQIPNPEWGSAAYEHPNASQPPLLPWLLKRLPKREQPQDGKPTWTTLDIGLNYFGRGLCILANGNQHLNSKIHRGTTVLCPFCKVGFTTASGLSHHLETGSCPNARGLNRQKIYDTIRQRDTNGIFTKNLLTYPNSDVETIATSASFNGRYYECYLCHNEFFSLQGLNQHLQFAHS